MPTTVSGSLNVEQPPNKKMRTDFGGHQPMNTSMSNQANTSQLMYGSQQAGGSQPFPSRY